jgi:hypothetical protein
VGNDAESDFFFSLLIQTLMYTSARAGRPYVFGCRVQRLGKI